MTKPIIKITGILTGIVLIILVCAGVYFNISNSEKTYTGYMMNTLISVRVKGSNADKAIEKTVSKIAEIDSRFNAYDPNSELYKVNQTASQEPVVVSNQFKDLLSESLNFHTLTSHAFDVSIKPLTDVWGINSANPHVPSDSSIHATLALVDSNDIILNQQSNTVFFEKSGMSIDFGAIAKGYAASEVFKELKNLNVKSACIDFGGTILLLGSNGSRQWLLGIQDPDGEKGEYFATIPLTDKIISTSGAYERNFVQDGVLYHHILDPETGYCANSGLKSVTIISEDGVCADALSTSVFIMGSEKGLELINSIHDTEAVLVTDDNVVIATDGIRENLKLVKDGYIKSEN